MCEIYAPELCMTIDDGVQLAFIVNLHEKVTINCVNVRVLIAPFLGSFFHTLLHNGFSPDDLTNRVNFTNLTGRRGNLIESVLDHVVRYHTDESYRNACDYVSTLSVDDLLAIGDEDV